MPEPMPPAPVSTSTVPARPAPTRVEVVTETLFGTEVQDPYRWLEDETSAEVQQWMRAQDSYARAVLGRLPEHAAITARLKELLYVETRSVPVHRGKRLFFSIKPAEAEKSIHYFQEDGGAPELLLDPNRMSEDGSLSVTDVFPSRDGSLIAYLERKNNADESTLRVMTVATRAVSSVDTIAGLRYTGVSWTPDASGFYYTWLPTDPAISEKDRPGFAEIRFHTLGALPAEDAIIRERTGDPTRWQSASLSRDGKYLFLQVSHGWSEADVYVQLRGEGKKGWRPLSVGQKSQTSVTAFRDVFYVQTDQGAPRFRLFAVDPQRMERAFWKEIVPEHPTAVLEDVSVVGGKLALSYLEHAHTRLAVHELNGKLVREVELPTIGSSSSLIGNDDEDTAYFSFSSFTYPTEIYRTSVERGGRELYSRVNAPIDPTKFSVEQHFYPSKDGTKIPLFLVSKRGLVRDGKNPALLFGYGGFNISMTPQFGASLYPWLERGGVYAVANLRGGGEYGETWHKAGMLANKQNVFDDFIAAAEWLIREKYTAPRHLGISGGSNGGLLVGAAMTQRPELFGAVVCRVPLLDMVRYDRFGMGQAWVPEYGDPTNAEHFPFLYRYSPYHHLQEGTRYPSLLMASADTDDRVDPLHARKFVARLEAVRGKDDARTLLRIEVDAGHGGADMKHKVLERIADEDTFLWAELHP